MEHLSFSNEYLLHLYDYTWRSLISVAILPSRCDNILCSIFDAFLFTRTDKADRDLYLPRFCRHIVTTTLCSIFPAFLLPVSGVIYHVFLLHFCCHNVRVDMPDLLLYFCNISCWRSFTVFFVGALSQHRMLQFCSFYDNKFVHFL